MVPPAMLTRLHFSAALSQYEQQAVDLLAAQQVIAQDAAPDAPSHVAGGLFWLAVRDAIASLSDYRRSPVLDSSTTPDRVLAAVDEMRWRAAHS